MISLDSKELAKMPKDSVLANLGLALSNAGQWITGADVGAVALAIRIARCIDVICDSGTDLQLLTPLSGRLAGLMQDLKLTPMSRDKATTITAEADNGQDYVNDYLRLTKATNRKPQTPRKKPGVNSRKPSK